MFSKDVDGEEDGTDLDDNDVITKGNGFNGVDKYACCRTRECSNFISDDNRSDVVDDALHDTEEYGVEDDSSNELAHRDRLVHEADRARNVVSGSDKGSIVRG